MRQIHLGRFNEDGSIADLGPLHEVTMDAGRLFAPHEQEPDPLCFGALSFTCAIWRCCREQHRLRVALGKLAGKLKQPRTTYKTIKRDCAKRNR